MSAAAVTNRNWPI